MKYFLVLLVLLVGCGEDHPMETVTIVEIEYSFELGEPDHKTIVEFPDGTRRRRYGKWGKVGDEIKARKDYYSSVHWESP